MSRWMLSLYRKWVLTQLSCSLTKLRLNIWTFKPPVRKDTLPSPVYVWHVLSVKQHILKLISNLTKLNCFSPVTPSVLAHLNTTLPFICVRMKSEKLGSPQQTNLPCVLCVCRIYKKTRIAVGHNTKRCFKGFALADKRFSFKTDRYANEVRQDSPWNGLQEILPGGSRGNGIFGWMTVE